MTEFQGYEYARKKLADRFTEEFYKTEIEKKLFRMLKNIWDDFDFVVCSIISMRGNEERIKKLIHYLEETGETDGGKISDYIDVINGEESIFGQTLID